MKTYKDRKEEARREAIAYQAEASRRRTVWASLPKFKHISRKSRGGSVLCESRENAII